MGYAKPGKEVIQAQADALNDFADKTYADYRNDAQQRDSLILNLMGLLSCLFVLRAEQTFDTSYMRFTIAMMEANARTFAKHRGVVIE